MKIIEQKVIRFISENELIVPGDRLLIALSGGPDSVFLFHFIKKFEKKYKISFGAVHINHLLRGKDSDTDENFCKKLCKEFEVEFHLKKKDVKSYAKKNKLSLEVAARKVRYEFFKKVSDKYNFTKILTAHNADDNAETVLLNLIKGAGLNGIAGIPVKRDNIIRPILCLSKKEISDYLDSNKLNYRIDKSNLSEDFERNFLRNSVIPLITKRLNRSFAKSVLTTSINFQSLVSDIKSIGIKYKQAIKVEEGKVVSLNLNELKTDSAFLRYILKETIDNCFNINSESSDVKKLFALFAKQTGKSEELSFKLLAKKERNQIIISKDVIADKFEKIDIQIGDEVKLHNQKLSINYVDKNNLKFNTSKNIEYISGDNIRNNFTVRNWKDGDRFFPIGMKGSKKISDYLSELKINSFLKKDQLVLENSGNIVWVIGKRIDDRFKVKSNTKKVLKLCLS